MRAKPDPPHPSTPVLRWIGAVAVLIGLGASSFALDGPVRDTAVNMTSLLLALAAGFTCLRAQRRATGPSGRGWAALSVACWLWAGSQALWTLFTTVLDVALPYPSPVELGYLAFPVVTTLALRKLGAARPGKGPGQSTSRRLLDRLMIGSALVLVAWIAVLDTVIDSSEGEVLAAAVSLYYPLSDVVLLTMVVLTIAQLRQDLLRWTLLGSGVLMMAITDHAFAYELATGSYRGGSGFACGWWLSFGLIGAGALVVRPPRPENAIPSTGVLLFTGLLPYVPLATAAVLCGANLIIAIEEDAVAEVLLVALVLLTLARQYVTVRDNLTLARTVQQREAELHHLAFHDALTGLANRALFLNRLEHALDLAGRDQRPVSVAFLDLDGFKEVNDSLGHATGDALLVRVAERLRGALRTADTLSRLGGDEFAVLVEHGDNPNAVAQGLIVALEAPFHLDGRTVAISASAGVATLEPGDSGAAQAANLLHRADVAMYAAKTSGKGHVQVHSPALDIAQRCDEPALHRAFAAALQSGGIEAVYQPVVDTVTGRMAAVEALARWNHDGFDIPPSTFIPICDQAGLFEQLTATMLEQSCGRLGEWNRQSGHQRLRVAVNVNPTEFSDATLPDRIAALLARHRLGGDQLALEMTEIAVGNRPEIAIEVMNRLRTLRVRIALDDFGTGYSTLARLSTTPVDTVKIDRFFVLDIEHDAGQRTFVAGLINLARHLGLRTVAEGVERPGQLRELRRLGCDLVQGNFVGRPTGAAGITALLLAEQPQPDRISIPAPSRTP